MSDKDILEKAIQKAIDGGWPGWIHDTGFRNFFTSKVFRVEEDANEHEEHVYFFYENDEVVNVPTYDLIFNHDFAKALWGEEDKWYSTTCTCGGRGIHMTDDGHAHECERVKADRGYKYHLQQMVIAEDPIKYLGENI